jgi:hypothetical protein
MSTPPDSPVRARNKKMAAERKPPARRFAARRAEMSEEAKAFQKKYSNDPYPEFEPIEPDARVENQNREVYGPSKRSAIVRKRISSSSSSSARAAPPPPPVTAMNVEKDDDVQEIDKKQFYSKQPAAAAAASDDDADVPIADAPSSSRKQAVSPIHLTSQRLPRDVEEIRGRIYLLSFDSATQTASVDEQDA